MKKRLVAILLVLSIVCSFPISVFAAEDEAMQAAQALHELGLFNGVGTNTDGTPIFELDRTPTRHEAITMLVNLLGKGEEARLGTWETPFTDVEDWAKPYVGYAYTNKLTGGTSNTTFGGEETVTAAQYITFVLLALGYTSGIDFRWDKSWELADQIGLTDGRYNAETKDFTRGDVAIVSNRALSVATKGSEKLLIEALGLKTEEKEKAITYEDFQGYWMRDTYLSKDYDEQTGLYYDMWYGLTCWVFEGDILTNVYFEEHDSGSKFVRYESGPYTIEGNKLKWKYYIYTRHISDEESSSNKIALHSWPDISKSGRSSTLYEDEYEILSVADGKIQLLTNKQYNIVERLVPYVGAPAYEHYKPIVTALEDQLKKNAVDHLDAPVITSVFQSYPTVISRTKGLKVMWTAVPNAAGYELLYREGEFGMWLSHNVDHSDSYGTVDSTGCCFAWNYSAHGVTYYFKVRAYAYNANGKKVYSDESNMVYATQP